jgi:hypothetical protein
VVLDGARGQEQPGADLRVRQPVAGQSSDLRLLGGQLDPGGDGALAGGLAGGLQLAAGSRRCRSPGQFVRPRLSTVTSGGARNRHAVRVISPLPATALTGGRDASARRGTKSGRRAARSR